MCITVPPIDVKDSTGIPHVNKFPPLLQLLSGTLLNAELTMSEDDGTCIQVPGVEVGGLISEDGVTGDSVVMTTDDHTAALTGLELDGSGNGSIFVFTDTSQLEALQVSGTHSKIRGKGRLKDLVYLQPGICLDILYRS